MSDVLLCAGGSFFIGIIGGLLGVGGGTFLVPFLVIAADMRPVAAVGISLFSVIGTSLGSTTRALEDGRANVGLALLLEPCLIIGSVSASLLAHRVSDGGLLMGFAAMMLGLSIYFILQRKAQPRSEGSEPVGKAELTDGVLRQEPDDVHYRPRRTGVLAALMTMTGAASGFFGIGGGSLNVPLMMIVSKVPMRAATATSTLTMSVTGAVAGCVHLCAGTVPAALVGASLLGVIPGGRIGAKLQARISVPTLRLAFAVLAAGVAIATYYKARSL